MNIRNKNTENKTNDVVLENVDFEPNFCFMHLITATEPTYATQKNFCIFSPESTAQYISETYVNVTRTYNPNNKTYTLAFSSEAPNNRWTGTWEILLAYIE